MKLELIFDKPYTKYRPIIKELFKVYEQKGYSSLHLEAEKKGLMIGTGSNHIWIQPKGLHGIKNRLAFISLIHP